MGDAASLSVVRFSMSTHRQLRREARERRRALTRPIQSQHSIAATRLLITSPWFRRSRTIGLYLATDGELDLAPFIKAARRFKKHLFLPALRSTPGNGLWFVEYRSGDQLIKNRFGISEPDIRKRAPMPLWAIDLILMPLVAFDPDGNRLGMGGGFYDKSLAVRQRPSHRSKPILIGMAHECQRVERIPTRSWDIPMDGVITERRRCNFSSRHD